MLYKFCIVYFIFMIEFISILLSTQYILIIFSKLYLKLHLNSVKHILYTPNNIIKIICNLKFKI